MAQKHRCWNVIVKERLELARRVVGQASYSEPFPPRKFQRRLLAKGSVPREPCLVKLYLLAGQEHESPFSECRAFAHCLENSVTGTHRYLAEQDKPSSYEGTTSAADAANREGYCGDWLKLGGAIVAKR